MEDTMKSGDRMTVAQMRKMMADQEAQIRRMQAAIESAESESVVNLHTAVSAVLSDVTPGVYSVAISDTGEVQITKSKTVARTVTTPRVTNPAATTHDADPYWTPGLSKGPQATEIRRLFYGEGMEPGAIAKHMNYTGAGAAHRALGNMAEARAHRDALKADQTSTT